MKCLNTLFVSFEENETDSVFKGYRNIFKNGQKHKYNSWDDGGK